MISAKQARELYHDVKVNEFLGKCVEPVVQKAAKEGIRTGFVYLGVEKYTRPVPYNDLTAKVIAKLIQLGYLASVEYYGEPFVPDAITYPGPSDAILKNYGIEIKW